MSDTDELADFISASLGTTLDAVYHRLIYCNFGLEQPELAMFAVALLKAMGREGREDRPTEVVLKVAFGDPVPPGGAGIDSCEGNAERIPGRT